MERERWLKVWFGILESELPDFSERPAYRAGPGFAKEAAAVAWRRSYIGRTGI
jgi:hypothetical protein